MKRERIGIEQLALHTFSAFDKGWFLLAAGDFDAGLYNVMTVSWGSLGTIWNKPFAQVAVRPTRHTFGFIERFDTFTLCAFPETCREALLLLGSRSGRDGDKVSQAGITPVRSSAVAAPSFAEADLVIECRKIYAQDLDPRGFLSTEIEPHYPEKDYHRLYFGEVLSVLAAPGRELRG